MLEPITLEDFSKDRFINGALLLVDKPLGKTSFWVVNKIRYHICKAIGVKKIKVGHAGTLDPLATGLLVICVGKYTKKIPELIGGFKVYDGDFTLGATTPSYDLETKIDAEFPTSHIDSEILEQTRESFLGEQEQTPPIFSAKKINGRKAYDLARKGEKVVMRKAPITIFDFSINEKDFPVISFDVKCSKGTYIRSLAYDFGKKLDSGAHLSKLGRTRVLDYALKDAFNVEEILSKLEDMRG